MTEIQLPKGGRLRAALYGLLATVALAAASPSIAETRAFSGQLDYGAFKRAADRKETIRITYSPGGTGAAALALARAKVIVDGRCNSACAWSFVKNANACFTSRASFGFHAAHDPGTGRRMDAATGYWLSTVRSSLRGRLQLLLQTSNLITLSDPEMTKHYGDRVCGRAPRTEVASMAAVKQPVEVSAANRAQGSATGIAKIKTPRVEAELRLARQAETYEAIVASVDILTRSTELDAPVDMVKLVYDDGTFFDSDPQDRVSIESEAAVAMLALPEMPDVTEGDLRASKGFAAVVFETDPSEGILGLLRTAAQTTVVATADLKSQTIASAGEDLDASRAPYISVGARASSVSALMPEATLQTSALLLEGLAVAADPCDRSPMVVRLDELSLGPCAVLPQNEAHLSVPEMSHGG